MAVPRLSSDKLLLRFSRDRRRVTAIEYGLIVALITVALPGILAGDLGRYVSGNFTGTAKSSPGR